MLMVSLQGRKTKNFSALWLLSFHLLQWTAEALPSSPMHVGRKPLPFELQHQLLGQTLCTAGEAPYNTHSETIQWVKCLLWIELKIKKMSYFLIKSGGIVPTPQSEIEAHDSLFIDQHLKMKQHVIQEVILVCYAWFYVQDVCTLVPSESWSSDQMNVLQICVLLRFLFLLRNRNRSLHKSVKGMRATTFDHFIWWRTALCSSLQREPSFRNKKEIEHLETAYHGLRSSKPQSYSKKRPWVVCFWNIILT